MSAHRHFLYLLMIVVLLLFTAGSAYLLTPLLLVGDAFISYMMTLFIAVVYGVFIVLFMHDLDIATHHHHAGIFFTVLIGSLASFLIIYLSLSGKTVGAEDFNPFYLAITFSIGFIVPYLVYYYTKREDWESGTDS